jgi:hypothetical protein
MRAEIGTEFCGSQMLKYCLETLRVHLLQPTNEKEAISLANFLSARLNHVYFRRLLQGHDVSQSDLTAIPLLITTAMENHIVSQSESPSMAFLLSSN